MYIVPGCESDSRPEISAILCWMASCPLRVGETYLLHHTTKTLKTMAIAIERIIYTPYTTTQKTELRLNEIGRVKIELQYSGVFDHYQAILSTGGFVLLHQDGGGTVASGVVC